MKRWTSPAGADVADELQPPDPQPRAREQRVRVRLERGAGEAVHTRTSSPRRGSRSGPSSGTTSGSGSRRPRTTSARRPTATERRAAPERGVFMPGLGTAREYPRRMEFRRIHALPPYAFAEIDALKVQSRRSDDRRDRPRVRQPRHPVAPDRGREAGRGRPQPAQPPLLDDPRRPAPAARDHRPLPAALRRRARPRDRGLRDHRGQGGVLAPHVGAARPGRHRARAEPVVPDPHLGPDPRRRRRPLRAPRPGPGLLRQPPRGVGAGVAAAAGRRDVVPAQPDRHVRRPRVHDPHGRVRAASTTCCSCTTSRTPSSASTATSRRRCSQVPGAKDVAVEIYSLTKSFSMAGWRVGFMLGNAEVVAALARLEELPRLRHVPTRSRSRRSSR